jgi:hypothetical protein
MQVVGAITGPFGSNGGKKSRADPKLLAYGRAKMAAFALQKIHFSNGRFWRKADVQAPDKSLFPPVATTRSASLPPDVAAREPHQLTRTYGYIPTATAPGMVVRLVPVS